MNYYQYIEKNDKNTKTGPKNLNDELGNEFLDMYKEVKLENSIQKIK